MSFEALVRAFKPKTMWLQARLWLCLILFWQVSVIGAGVLARSEMESLEGGWVILCMLALVILCMATERGRWSTWLRVGFVPLAWVAHAILSIPAGVIVAGVLIFIGGRIDLMDRATTLAAAVPIVLFAMRQSRLFAVM